MPRDMSTSPRGPSLSPHLPIFAFRRRRHPTRLQYHSIQYSLNKSSTSSILSPVDGRELHFVEGRERLRLAMLQ